MTFLFPISIYAFDIFNFFYMTFSQVDMDKSYFDKLCVSLSQCF
jgi:hypothetical protein